MCYVHGLPTLLVFESQPWKTCLNNIIIRQITKKICHENIIIESFEFTNASCHHQQSCHKYFSILGREFKS